MTTTHKALKAAVEAGEEETCRELLAQDPDAVHTCPLLLHEAAAEGHAAVVALLLDAGAPRAAVDEDGQTPLHIAARDGFVDICIQLAATDPCPEAAALDNYKMTPFHLACEGGHDTIVALLLGKLTTGCARGKKEADEMRRGSALMLAQRHEHHTIVELLQSERCPTPPTPPGSSTM